MFLSQVAIMPGFHSGSPFLIMLSLLELLQCAHILKLPSYLPILSSCTATPEVWWDAGAMSWWTSSAEVHCALQTCLKQYRCCTPPASSSWSYLQFQWIIAQRIDDGSPFWVWLLMAFQEVLALSHLACLLGIYQDLCKAALWWCLL